MYFSFSPTDVCKILFLRIHFFQLNTHVTRKEHSRAPLVSIWTILIIEITFSWLASPFCAWSTFSHTITLPFTNTVVNRDSKEKEEHSLVKNKHQILNGSLRKTLLGAPMEGEARRVLREVNIASLKVVFALTNQKRVQ